MTSYTVIFEAFIAQIESDEWSAWEEWEREEDWKQLLLAAIPWFKFPRISLTLGDTGFINELTNNEIQIIVAFMKTIWLERVVMSWDNLRPLFSERDFSMANMLKEFTNKQANQLKVAKELEARYYRSINERPFPYSNLSGV